MLALTLFTFLNFSVPSSKKRGLDQTGSQTCLIFSQLRSFYKFKFLVLTPDRWKQGPYRWWKNRHLPLKFFPVAREDQWHLDTARGLEDASARVALTGKDKVSQREHCGTPKLETLETLFKFPASRVRETRWQRRPKNQALSGWDSGTCLWNSLGYGEYCSLSEPLLSAGFQSLPMAYLEGNQIMFTHYYKD